MRELSPWLQLDVRARGGPAGVALDTNQLFLPLTLYVSFRLSLPPSLPPSFPLPPLHSWRMNSWTSVLSLSKSPTLTFLLD